MDLEVGHRREHMSNREEVQAALDKLTNTPIYAYCQELREENKRLREALEIIEKSYSGSPCNIARAALEGKP
jgi:hypothetical protein